MFRARDEDFERLVIEEACVGHVDPEALLQHAHRRAAHPEQGDRHRVRVGVDWLAEALAEGADWANYLCWDLEDHFDAGERDEITAAIAEVASAYERVRGVRDRRRLG